MEDFHFSVGTGGRVEAGAVLASEATAASTEGDPRRKNGELPRSSRRNGPRRRLRNEKTGLPGKENLGRSNAQPVPS